MKLFIDILCFGCALSGMAATESQWIQMLRASPASAILVGGQKADSNVVEVTRSWTGAVCTSTVVNRCQTPMRLARVGLFDFNHGLPGSTPFYGEGFQMLAQNGGTLAAPEDWGSYPDRTHYRLEDPDGLRTVRGMMLLRPAVRISCCWGSLPATALTDEFRSMPNECSYRWIAKD